MTFNFISPLNTFYHKIKYNLEFKIDLWILDQWLIILLNKDMGSNGPYEGLTCVELTTTIAGPAAGAMLADWGCDVNSDLL